MQSADPIEGEVCVRVQDFCGYGVLDWDCIFTSWCEDSNCSHWNDPGWCVDNTEILTLHLVRWWCFYFCFLNEIWRRKRHRIHPKVCCVWIQGTSKEDRWWRKAPLRAAPSEFLGLPSGRNFLPQGGVWWHPLSIISYCAVRLWLV